MGAEKSAKDADFTAFVVGATPELARIAWYLTGDAEQAKELVQASLVKTYMAWPRVRDGEAVAYTRRVMVNHRTDLWRRHRREVLSADPSSASSTEPNRPIDCSDLVDSLVGQLRALPLKQRRVVVLRYYCDLSENDVAHELGISTGAVKNAAARGLAGLRQHTEAIKEWST